MSNVIIHVGLRKTATTWLQDVLFPNIKDINYIAKNSDNYPQWLIKWHYLDDYAFNHDMHNIKNNFFSFVQNDKVNVLSSEAFTNTSVIYSQADRIKKIVPNAKIIITLRNPIDVIKSHYKLDIQDGINFLDLEKYLDWKRTPFDLFKRKPIYMPDFFYDENIDYYQQLFGSNNVLVLKFEDMKNNPKKYFDHLSQFLNVTIELDELQLNTKKNESNKDNLADMKFNNLKQFFEKNMSVSLENLSVKKENFNISDTVMSNALEEKIKQYLKGKCFGYY